MERAVAVLVGGVGVVLLTFAAVVWSGPDGGRGGGLDVLALQPGASERAEQAGRTGLLALGAAAPTASTPPQPPSTPAPPAPPPVAPPPGPLPAALTELAARISSGAIRFEVGRAELDDTALALLDELAAQLVARPDAAVVVRGHTDSTGTDAVNHELSARRARVVVDRLLAGGARPEQLVAVGLGPSEPVADNATVDGRRANRRSEVLLDGRSP